MDYKLSWLTHMLLLITIAGCQEDTPSRSITCENDTEICVNLYQCPVILEKLKNLNNAVELEHIKSSLCGFDGKTPMVCCSKESESRIIFKNTSDEVATNRPRPSTNPLYDMISQSTTNRKPATVYADPFPDRSVCGQFGIDDRIVGGTIASIDDFPWLARIKFIQESPKLEEQREKFICSASLITDRYLISAAHCFTTNLKAVSVRLGEWNIQSPGACEEGICTDMPVEIDIESIIPHPAYEKRNKTYADIALIRLKKPANFTDFIQPICLPTSEYVKMQDYSRDSVFTTAGWGITEFGTVSVIKRKVDLPSVPFESCKTRINSIKNLSSQALICAGGKKEQDTCMGDSGGPLMRGVRENYVENWYLYGITSVGTRKCGTEGAPGLYTRVTAFMDWIREVVKGGTPNT